MSIVQSESLIAGQCRARSAKHMLGASGVGAAALVMTLASAPLLAQTAAQSASADAQAVAQVAQAAPTAGTPASVAAASGTAVGGDQLEEVTVTAERIATSELRTPISLTALSTQQLTQTNVIEVTDLRGLVPSLEIVQAGQYGTNQVSVTIRGVGGEPRFFNGDNAVGFYIDDMYIPTGQNLNLDFFDLQSVQVLDGPQGTLFGRNTLGGALLYQTVAPGKDFGGFAQVSVGNYDRLETEGAVNMPFSDVLTSRFAFQTSDYDGYINDILDNRKHNDNHGKEARFELRFQPTSSFTADLFGGLGANHDNGDEVIEVNCNDNAVYTSDYNSAHPNGPTYCQQFPPLGLPYTVYGTSTANLPNPLYASGPNTTETPGVPPYLTGPLLGPSGLGTPHAGGFTPYTSGQVGTTILHLTYDVNDVLTLKSITGLRYSTLDTYRDDGTTAGLYTESNGNWFRNWSEELQGVINAFNGRLTAVGGLYYFHANTVTLQDTGPDYDDPVGYYYANIGAQKSEAAYLQVTGEVTPKFSVIAGVRYTYDWKNSASKVWEGCYGSYLDEYQAYQSGGPAAYSGGCWIPGPSPNDYASASAHWTHTDPRLQLQYQWTPDFMTYLSATSGYLAGGFNAQLPYFPPPGVPPQVYYNTPFEEETVWNYEFGTKGAFFNHRLSLQFAGYDQIFDNYQGSVLSYYKGIDVTTTTSAADAHERGIEATLDAIPIPNLTVELTYSYLTQSYDTIFPGALAAGLTKTAALTSAPLKTFAIVGTYVFHLGNGATIVPSVNWRYVGNEWQGTYPLQFLAPGYGLVGGTLMYNAPGDKWAMGLWGNNILNRYYYESYAPITFQDTNMGDSSIQPGIPRMWGLRFRWNF